ncbi:ABC transporter [Streptomyces purpureus]|uniref:ABC transporter n=1 Tax=Streptomyces purpureus TaxID=1951 RepID=A0A918GXS3_9ACTN|nr:ABC transporter [Streptomyces purpureus]GGT18587.1 hypothetical protein GCM10014713_09330 [Streptomyces purpureus]
MTALLRYQTGLLLRSQRWLPPVLLYVIFLGIGVRVGEPVLGALGWAAAALVPVTAWLVRICLDQEPPAARHVVAAAAGRQRGHLAAVLTAATTTGLLALLATPLVTYVSRPTSADYSAYVAPLPAGLAGAVAAGVAVLTGTALGTLCSRPLVLGRGWSTAATLLGSLLVLVTTGSPAHHAVTALVTGSRDGTVHIPWLALLGAGALAAAAVALACRLTAWRE